MQDEINEFLDSSSETEVEETVEAPQEVAEVEAEETPAVDVEQLQATNKKLYERAKKAEADLKALKGAPKPAGPAATVPVLAPNVEETVLLANGMPEELLGELKAVAQVRNTSLIKAQNDPIFLGIKEKFEKTQKQRDASLPASRGASQVKPKKDFNSPGLTAAEHKAIWESQQK